MLPYMLLLLFVAVLGILLCEIKPSKRNDLLFLVIVTAVTVAMASIRAESVGVDYPMYADYFQQVCQNGSAFLLDPQNTYRMEFGYCLLNYLVSLVSHDTRVFMAVCAAVTISLRAVAIMRQTTNKWIAMYVFVSFGFFGYTMCTLRQELAVSVALFAIPYLQKKKILPYMLLVLLAASFHKSTLVLIPIYFIAHIPMTWKSMSVYAGGTLLVMIFSWPVISFVTQYIYKFYAPDAPGSYYLRPRDFNTAFIPLIVFVVVMLLKNKLLKFRPENIVLINFSCYAAMLFILTIKHFIFQRIALIFLPAASLLLIPQVVSCMKADESKFDALEEEYKNADKNRQRQLLHDYNIMKQQRKEARAAYRTAIGMTLFTGFVYQLFLLNMNRLLLAPYTSFLFQ